MRIGARSSGDVKEYRHRGEGIQRKAGQREDGEGLPVGCGEKPTGRDKFIVS